VTEQTFWTDWPRDFVGVRGADAHAYLNSQLSQDTSSLGQREAVWAYVLQPNGKVDALARVTQVDPELIVVDVDGGYGAAVLVRLDRFRIRVKVELEPLSWRCIAIRGPDAATAAASSTDERTYAVVSWWADRTAADLIGPDPEPPMGIPGADRAWLERARIVAGWPALGAELTDRTIPSEVTPLLDLAVSFAKGCYPGQELVERMHSRGSLPPRLLRRVRSSGPDIAIGSAVVVDGGDVGLVTSAVGAEALALISRAVEPGTVGEVEGVTVSIAALR
jgi:folate-binding protein YgfZ